MTQRNFQRDDMIAAAVGQIRQEFFGVLLNVTTGCLDAPELLPIGGRSAIGLDDYCWRDDE